MIIIIAINDNQNYCNYTTIKNQVKRETHSAKSESDANYKRFVSKQEM